jgi:hypothetical protein
MIDVAIAPYDGRSSSPGRKGVEKIRRPHVEQSDARPDHPDTNHRHFSGGFEAIAHAAIDRDLRVSWFTLEALTATIARSWIDAFDWLRADIEPEVQEREQHGAPPVVESTRYRCRRPTNLGNRTLRGDYDGDGRHVRS